MKMPAKTWNSDEFSRKQWFLLCLQRSSILFMIVDYGNPRCQSMNVSGYPTIKLVGSSHGFPRRSNQIQPAAHPSTACPDLIISGLYISIQLLRIVYIHMNGLLKKNIHEKTIGLHAWIIDYIYINDISICHFLFIYVKVMYICVVCTYKYNIILYYIIHCHFITYHIRNTICVYT